MKNIVAFLFIFIPLWVNAQKAIQLVDAGWGDVNITFTESSYADIDISIVENFQDLTVEIINSSRQHADFAFIESGVADRKIGIRSYGGDLSVRVQEGGYGKLKMKIVYGGCSPDYVIYTERKLTNQEVVAILIEELRKKLGK
jgi:citrate lyase alpha subunit